uniref:Uncharacterized protein n=1 Tax=Utricularia reniformis TaxID=192314 RepID=A0A1Y0B1S5_9LAMI|nr:hypothetical protein AEK19_MT1190 [Utricularia reniformis]ART31402.1 hypothetical protein AEK19_MT1190 [Utricularia reniformis]
MKERRSYRALDYVSDIWQVGKARLEKKDYPRGKSIYLVLPNLDAKGS